MPSIEQNLKEWNAENKWKEAGEEWSSTWGGAEPQWYGSIFPRIHNFLPAKVILEIAPGHGRWTNYLKNYCETLYGVDLAQNCVDICKERFASDKNLIFYVNDGTSLDMIPDHSVDFVFSFDSLVHAEIEVIRSYLNQLSKKLKSDGVGFIHHSNLDYYRGYFKSIELLPEIIRKISSHIGITDYNHWRASSVSAEKFQICCEKTGLQCIGQELVNWGTSRMIDSFSLFTPKNSKWIRTNKILLNKNYMVEARLIKKFSFVYSRTLIL